MVKIQDSVFNLMAICYFRYLNQTNVFFHQLTRNKTYDNTSWVRVLYKSRTSNCSVWLRTILCSVNEQITCSRHIINCLIMGLLTRIKVLLTFYHLYMHNSDDILPKYWHFFLNTFRLFSWLFKNSDQKSRCSYIWYCMAESLTTEMILLLTTSSYSNSFNFACMIWHF